MKEAIRALPDVRHVLAPNPGPMTFTGTNSWIVGRGEVAVIDPGPAHPGHLQALLGALDPGERVAAILVTHAHVDHTQGVPALQAATGAPVLAFGPAEAGRSVRMQALAEAGELQGGEGIDTGFHPDRTLADGQTLRIGGTSITALWTPGHMANHLCFALPDHGAVFTGDLVMGWATSLVSPPDGDLSAFLAALDRLAERRDDRFYLPGHGPAVDTPGARLAELSAHRRMRHDQIRAALAQAPGTAAEIAARLYTQVDPRLLPAAARNVLAHLIDLVETSEAAPEGPLTATARFHAA